MARNVFAMRFDAFLNALRKRGRYTEAESYKLIVDLECSVQGINVSNLTIKEAIELIGQPLPQPIPPGWSHYYRGKAS